LLKFIYYIDKCFHYRADAIVCVDACFTQKRRKNSRGTGRGPHDIHPQTVFLSEEDVKSMEVLVDELRPSRPSRSGVKQPKPDQDSDGYEPQMKVPTSVLNGCEESFVAADEKRTKASVQFFADTGLMALLCRHDRVLWLVNMTSPGERQYYVLALIKQLFDHIPSDMTIGLLYDIGCKLHRSCAKWEFLDEDILNRITFGIAVFHAFGHQWPCQLIYHPRKCKGFGLTDGEGCERFWSSIKLIIPAMRVSGYYQRLYTIDTQVGFLDNKSLIGLGQWLNRKWFKCQEKKTTMNAILAEVNISEDVLQSEWNEQVKEQTKPMKRKHL
jgi:hypothetical protein